MQSSGYHRLLACCIALTIVSGNGIGSLAFSAAPGDEPAAHAPPASGAWKKIYDQRNINFYIDPSLIVQKGTYVAIPYLVDLPVRNELNLLLDGRPPYSSVVSVVNYDCSRRSLPPRSERYWQSAENYFYAGALATGGVMVDPMRREPPEWIAGFDGSGIVYYGQGEQVSQAYFVNKVLEPELKICRNHWQSPPGFQPEKTPPYTQIKTPACSPANPAGGLLESCYGTTNRKISSTYKDQNQVFALPGTYSGNFLNGSPNGYGRYQVEGGEKAGDLYLGFFRAGNFEGFGTYYHRATDTLKGALFVGNFRDHKKNGPGVYRFADGSASQEGIWEDDKLVKPRKTFLGDTLQGLPFCAGVDATAWTDCFGYLEFEPIQGQRLQRLGTPLYAGGFKDGLPDGVGTFFSKDGRVHYQGQLKAATAEGLGTEFYDYSGDRYYSGGFSGGKRHGKGVSVSGGGSTLWERYEGEYVNGSRSGQGALWVEKSYRYVGGFKGSRFDGYGVYTPERVPGGEVVVKEGIWKAGRLLKPGASPQSTTAPVSARPAQ